MQRVLIIGAGGQAQVVADILKCAHNAGKNVIPLGYLDDDPNLVGRTFLGLPVLGVLAEIANIPHDALIIAIGNNSTRRRLFEIFRERGENFVIAVHPAAVIGAEVSIGIGTMICAGVVINPGSTIGENVILNTCCTIDHHNCIGNHVHIAPGVRLGGEVEIGDGVLVGIGATVMPRCRVGDWTTVGAGACVTKSVPAGLTVVGVPARPLQRKE